MWNIDPPVKARAEQRDRTCFSMNNVGTETKIFWPTASEFTATDRTYLCYNFPSKDTVVI
jgi:hypothetical protein